MISALREWKDQLLGRGDASITVPVFDGALKSNNILEEALVFTTLEAPEDLASDGRSLFVADGNAVLCYDVASAAAAPVEVHRFDRVVTALACLAEGRPGSRARRARGAPGRRGT